MHTNSYIRHITRPAQSSYFFCVTILALVLSLIPLLLPVTTNTRSETGVWTAILLIMAFGCTAEHTKLTCLWRDILASASLQKHVLFFCKILTRMKLLRLLYFYLVFHSQECVRVYSVTHHTESDALRGI